MGIHWNEVWETVMGAGIIAILGFFMYLWKLSLYGKIEEMKKMFEDFKKDEWEPLKSKVQLKETCGDNRQLCQLRILDKLDSIKESVDELKEDHGKFQNVKGTVEQLVHAIIGLGERIDKHINGK